MNATRLFIGIFIILIGVNSLFNFNFNIFKYAVPLFMIYIGYRIIVGRENS